jgi:2-methylcitrate dehydratase PrpD
MQSEAGGYVPAAAAAAAAAVLPGTTRRTQTVSTLVGSTVVQHVALRALRESRREFGKRALWKRISSRSLVCRPIAPV